MRLLVLFSILIGYSGCTMDMAGLDTSALSAACAGAVDGETCGESLCDGQPPSSVAAGHIATNLVCRSGQCVMETRDCFILWCTPVSEAQTRRACPAGVGTCIGFGGMATCSCSSYITIGSACE